MTGTLPEYLNGLISLKNLFLHFNEFSGTIPDYYMPNLRMYYLWDNQLTGTLPPSVFKMSSLRELKVTSNKLTGSIVIPEDFERTLINRKC